MAEGGPRPKGRRWSDRLVAKVKKLEADLDRERSKRPSRGSAGVGRSPDPLAEARQRWLRGNYEEARAGYEKLLSDEKQRATAAIGIARTWVSEGQDDKALAAVEDALKKDAKNPDLLAARAELLFEMGKWEEASKDAEAAI